MSVVVARGRKTGEWLADPGFGVYVHIPFCRHRCNYCDFNTYEGLDALHGPYVDALVAEIRSWDGVRRPATSVFIGGGTPTLLAPRDLGRVLDAVDEVFGIAPGAEVTVEANPETVDRPRFEGLVAAGVNRVSVGMQSAVPHVLKALGRTHDPRAPLDAIDAARAAGIGEVNLDLIYGSPWETAEDWRQSLATVSAACPDHVSAYALTVEEGTPLHTLVATGRVPDVDPDTQAARFEVAQRELAEQGYHRYEVSNWSRPGRASDHNVLYWSAGNYVGFGAGAHSHIDGHRWWTTRLPRDYIDAVTAGASTVAGDESLDPEARAAEALVLGLRLASGVPVEDFANRFGDGCLEQRRARLDELEGLGLLDLADGRIRLTPAATLVGNEVAARLL
ncbi:MAG TPA: radical SAM family heme chaperone HemW [Actinomycetota bacterium]|nr:radical SAM family heme chaperone HemW [Actinomycetota bacterium]